MCVTRRTLRPLEWSRRKENPTVDMDRLKEPTLAVLAGVSKENGLEHFKIFERSVNKEKFEEWLEELRAKIGQDPALLFLDNLGVHTCGYATAAMKRLRFRYLYNVPYSPQYNPIELVFSQAKGNFKGLRARKLMGLTQEPHETLVARAFQNLKK